MDDLISRKALLADLCEDREEGTFEFTDAQAEAADRIIRYVVSRIEKLPSVPAVPLDKLCEWLDENVGMPLECFGTLCENCKYDKDKNFIRCWKALLEKWMEEQNAAD